MKDNNQSSGGIGFVGLLTIVFITLKLTGYIDWSWWLVLSPVLAGVAVVIGLIVIVVVAAVIDVFVSNRRIRRR